MKHFFKPGGGWHKDGIDYTIKTVEMQDYAEYEANGWFSSFEAMAKEANDAEAEAEAKREEEREARALEKARAQLLAEQEQAKKAEAKKVEADKGEDDAAQAYETKLRDEIKALGGKPGGRSSIETLEKQLEDLRDGNSN